MWLWKLIADPDIARSRMLNNFLELTDAARMVTKCAYAAAGVLCMGQSGLWWQLSCVTNIHRSVKAQVTRRSNNHEENRINEIYGCNTAASRTICSSRKDLTKAY